MYWYASYRKVLVWRWFLNLNVQLIQKIATTNSCILCQLYKFISCGCILYFSSITSIIANSEAKYLPNIRHILWQQMYIHHSSFVVHYSSNRNVDFWCTYWYICILNQIKNVFALAVVRCNLYLVCPCPRYCMFIFSDTYVCTIKQALKMSLIVIQHSTQTLRRLVHLIYCHSSTLYGFY